MTNLKWKGGRSLKLFLSSFIWYFLFQNITVCPTFQYKSVNYLLLTTFAYLQIIARNWNPIYIYIYIIFVAALNCIIRTKLLIYEYLWKNLDTSVYWIKIVDFSIFIAKVWHLEKWEVKKIHIVYAKDSDPLFVCNLLSRWKPHSRSNLTVRI